MRRVIRDMGLAALGYVIAVLVAAFGCVLVTIGIAMLFDKSAPGGLPGESFFFLISIGIAFTGMTAWPGFIITVAIGEGSGFRHPGYFSAGGAATAVLAAGILSKLLGDPMIFRTLVFTPAGYFGGAVGGLVYGLYARRFNIFMP